MLFIIGISELGDEDLNGAFEKFNRYVELYPKDGKGYLGLGLVYHKEKKDYPQALIAYSKAIELTPDLAMAYNMRGLAYYENEKYDQAMTDLEQSHCHRSKFISGI